MYVSSPHEPHQQPIDPSLQLSDTEAGTIAASYLLKFRKDDTMTKLLRKPNAVIPDGLDIRGHLITATGNTTDGHISVWCLYYELNPPVLALWLFLTLGTLTAIGIIIAFSIVDSKLGLSLGTALLAFLTTVQGTLVMYSAH